jgi:hypothetical protein
MKKHNEIMNGFCIIRKADNSKINPDLFPNTPKLGKYEYITDVPFTYLALVDRTKDKSRWWTQNSNLFMVFKKKEAADIQLSKLRYGEYLQVVSYKKSVFKTSNWFWKVKEHGLTKMLDEHEQLWHDDNWDEGVNYDN